MIARHLVFWLLQPLFIFIVPGLGMLILWPLMALRRWLFPRVTDWL